MTVMRRQICRSFLRSCNYPMVMLSALVQGSLKMPLTLPYCTVVGRGTTSCLVSSALLDGL